MNVEIGAEAALFPEKEYINGIAVAAQRTRLRPPWLKRRQEAASSTLCRFSRRPARNFTGDRRSSCSNHHSVIIHVQYCNYSLNVLVDFSFDFKV
jgi:hypothetical protein